MSMVKNKLELVQSGKLEIWDPNSLKSSRDSALGVGYLGFCRFLCFAARIRE